MSLGQLTSSLFITCDPAPRTVTVTEEYTTVYTTVLLAACPTSSWMATYTITEICAGSPEDYQTQKIPPCFVETTVYCDVCDEKTLPIICPAPTMTADVIINGDGVTAESMPTAGSYESYGDYDRYSDDDDGDYYGGKPGSGPGGKNSGDEEHDGMGGSGAGDWGGNGSGENGSGDKQYPGKEGSGTGESGGKNSGDNKNLPGPGKEGSNSGGDASGKDASGKDAGGKDASGKDASGKDAGDKPLPGKDGSNKSGPESGGDKRPGNGGASSGTPPAKPAKTMDPPASSATAHGDSYVEAGGATSIKQNMGLLFGLAIVAGRIAFG